MLKLTGKILKGIGGFYYVLDETGHIHECKARGRFRKDGTVPLPGDNVEFVPEVETFGFIEELKPRHNELKRPRVANVDAVAIVVSAQKPAVDLLLCDKLIIFANRAGIEPLLVINKCDISDAAQIEALKNEYNGVCTTVCVSAAEGEGLEDLKGHLRGKCTCFAGQSAAGKSSILNALFPQLSLGTGVLSKKTDRGRHTTRQSELLVLDGFTGTMVDTPGFSFLEADDMLPEQLSIYYDDMKPFADECRFAQCLHTEEPQCGIKQAVERGQIQKSRYQRYLTILKELQEKRNNEYD